MSRKAGAEVLSARVWRAMFGFLMRSAPQRSRALAQRGLTPNDSRALFNLDASEGCSMRSLADKWECDPSNATWIVDRLEKLGLAERRPLPNDRRVKLVGLTARGQRTRAALLKEFHRPPRELVNLDVEDLQALDRILAKLSPQGSAGGPGNRKPLPLALAANREREPPGMTVGQ